jgi:hypothetical protein
LAPNDDVEPTRVRLNHGTENVMLVGHLPHLSRLVSRLFALQQTTYSCDSRWAALSNLNGTPLAAGSFVGCSPPTCYPAREKLRSAHLCHPMTQRRLMCAPAAA